MILSIFSALSALLLGCAVFLALLRLVVRAGRMHVLAAAPVALAFFVGLESIVLNFLSIFDGVSRFNIFLFHLIVVGIWLLYELKFQTHKFRVFHLLQRAAKRLIARKEILLLFPVIILLSYYAVFFQPSTFDSLTYHMARVAHWIQLQSVDYYPTNISRQNVLGPGAEYLILFFQIISNSDCLANLIQFFSFLLLPGVLLYFMRVFKMPDTLSPWIILLAVTSPMAFMQASTTQNDLVATVMTLAILVVTVRLFLGRVDRISLHDYALLGVCLAAGFLVKPTSLLIAAPFVGMGILFQWRNLFFNKEQRRKTFKGIALATVILAIIAGPDVVRKVQHNGKIAGPGLVETVYPILSEWDSGRLLNPVLTFAQNSPWPGLTTPVLQSLGLKDMSFTRSVFRPHQDFIGNPIQACIVIFLGGITLLLFPAVFFRPRYLNYFLVSIAPLMAWICFSLIVKNQLWISRLQLPVFLILPFSFLFILKMGNPFFCIRKGMPVILCILAAFSYTYSFYAVAHHQDRPLNLQLFFGRLSRTSIYDKGPRLIGQFGDPKLVVNAVKKEQCAKVGILGNGATLDYPVTWAVMKAGGQTRHVFPRDQSSLDWPCILYVDPHAGNDENSVTLGRQWIKGETDYIYYKKNQ